MKTKDEVTDYIMETWSNAYSILSRTKDNGDLHQLIKALRTKRDYLASSGVTLMACECLWKILLEINLNLPLVNSTLLTEFDAITADAVRCSRIDEILY